jgi:hypothetical protein
MASISPVPRDIQEDNSLDQVLRECEEYLKESRRLREVTALKAKGKTLSSSMNPTTISKKHLRKKDRISRKHTPPELKDYTNTAGIDEDEIQRRKAAAECLRCAWTAGRKGAYPVKDCIRPIKLGKGTASYSNAKEYEKIKQSCQ